MNLIKNLNKELVEKQLAESDNPIDHAELEARKLEEMDMHKLTKKQIDDIVDGVHESLVVSGKEEDMEYVIDMFGATLEDVAGMEDPKTAKSVMKQLVDEYKKKYL